jgi:pimeloyl-ACP methyl ester carboxylesterase
MRDALMTETRTLDDAREWILDRLARRLHPFHAIDPTGAREVVDGLTGLDPEAWTAAWGTAADDRAAVAKSTRNRAARREAWLGAYQFAFIGRFPVPNHRLKRACYERALEYFGEAAKLRDPPIETVKVPFSGRPGEGDAVRFYIARPELEPAQTAPVLVAWGGIDSWKEEVAAILDEVLPRGIAVVMLDMPGTGESPILASRDAERQFTPVFDWLDEQPEFHATGRAVMGASFGGYWAMKLAYTHRSRLCAAVNWGGGVHVTFSPEWQAKSRNASSYLMDLMAARARIFGGKTFEDYIAKCQELSLLDQGYLDTNSAELLLVNGRDDVQNSIEDIYLSLDHGNPKSARIFDGGHMGIGPVLPTILTWLEQRLSSEPTNDDAFTAP